ncbi:zinc finger, CCHC-type containing protein [Tanacetum coccineum]
MHFLLSSISVVYVLTTPIPEDGGDVATVKQIRKRVKWDNDDYVCRGLILNGMFDSSFDIYQNVESSKELWDSLEAKYMAENASSKKFLVINFTNYKMTDSRPVMEQYNELLGILGRFTQHKMNMDEAIQVSCIIDKLPPSWKDFKHTLKHLKEELTLVELGSHLCIEESLRVQDSDKPKGNNVAGPSVVNMVEHNNSSRYNDNKGKHKHHDNTRVDPNKKSKVTCWKYGKHGHYKIAKGVTVGTNAMVRHKGFASGMDDDVAWWVDSGVTFHVCKDRCWFKTYESSEGWDDIFDENRLSSVPRPSLRIPNRIEDIGGLVVPEEVTEEMDVNTDFMNGELDEEVYMNQPQGFIMPDNENKVDLTKEFLSSRFSMQDMGEADVILGIRIKHESNGIAISQSHYIEKELKKFSYFDCTPVSTRINTSEKLMPNNGQGVSQLEYSRVIGCLMYSMTCTKPDIAFAVGKLSRYTSNLGTQYWQAIQWVLKYLKKTMDYKLTYTGYPSVLEGYTDASWISNSEDNSSTSGWVFLFGGGAISWASKKQTCITGSTIESEFVALAVAGKEAEWLRNLILEVPLWFKPIAPISIRCDSATTLSKAYSQMYNGKSRHLGVRHSMIRKLIMNRVISIEFVRSQKNLADHLTKGLARDLVIKSAEGMGLKSN